MAGVRKPVYGTGTGTVPVLYTRRRQQRQSAQQADDHGPTAEDRAAGRGNDVREVNNAHH